MMAQSPAVALLLTSIALTTTNIEAATCQPLSLSGVVVDDVAEATALKSAGLQPGDVLLSWQRPLSLPTDPFGNFGVLRSVFDWRQLVNEQFPRGPIEVTVEGRRKPLRLSLESLSTDSVTRAVRPRLNQNLLDLFLLGRGKIAVGDLESGITYWQQLSAAAREETDPDLACWAFLQISQALTTVGQHNRAANNLHSLISPYSSMECKIETYESLGDAYYRARNLKAAEGAYRQSSFLREANLGKTLGWAKIENLLGRIAWEQRDMALAEQHWRAALRVQEYLAPISIPTASSLANLGVLISFQGDQISAQEYVQRALSMMTTIAPDSPPVAAMLTTLGNIQFFRGNLRLAEEYAQRSMNMKRRLAPKGPQVAASLNNLGALAFSRGDFETASAYYKEAIDAWKESAPESLDLAIGMANLGNALLYRGEFDLARYYYEESLALRLKLAPQSLDAAGILNNLGSLFQFQGKPELAEQYHHRALAIQERLAPHSLNVARSLGNLSTIAIRRGDLKQAKELASQALSISADLAPTSPETADMFTSLGLISRLAGDTRQAISLLERAVEIMQGLSLDSEEVARSHYELGKAYLHGDPIAASEQFEQAIGVLEHQIAKRARLQDVRSTFETEHEGLYRDYGALLIQLGQPEDAFLVLERYRARRLLTLLAERDLVISDEIPQELEEARRSIEVRYDDLQRRMIAASRGKPLHDLAELAIEIRKARIEHDAVVAKIKRASPRFASIRYPQALDLSAVRECLDEGTILLTYGVGSDDLHIFATSHNEPLIMKTVNVGEAELRTRVAELRELTEESRSQGRVGQGRRETLRQRAKNLYDLLVAPVEAVVAKHKRIFIIPDGPLHILPWGALIREEKSSPVTGLQYLTEWRPLHIGTSATIFSEFKNERARISDPARVGKQGLALAAFGDPNFGRKMTVGEKSHISEPRVRAAVERGFNFQPLPDSRIEVETIGNLYQDKAKIFLGYDASEANVKSLPRNTPIVHFATHATLDERFPLNSAVVLSIPEKFEEGKDNGLLQAWEIFEQVRLDADLVVLSACESGLGKEMGGEGLIGLTRAFQYAGARSVMASLWKISDRTTAELMVRFYKHLKAGLPKDEALRAAQMELIRGPIQVRNEKGEVEEIDASAPYYWAAFQIYGDWQ